ncbi:MAG: ACT domain-containing protein, partial [Verrucomicrobiae bacterium]|nr:ACT domain-containing protein [Verrucomicrobiae bacterium]
SDVYKRQFLGTARTKTLPVEMVELDRLYKESDFITLHVPVTEQTRGMINKDAIAKMKKSVRIINCARGDIIVQDDLYEALKSGRIAGAALDVFEKEPPVNLPFAELDNVVLTPHLGASTHEAQESCGTEIAEQVAEALTGGTIRNAVNLPSIDAKVLAALQPYISFGEKLGRLLAQLSPRRIERLAVEYFGKAADLETGPITRAVLKTFLENAEGGDVNYVNAPSIAHRLGIRVEERKSAEPTDYTELITVRAETDGLSVSVAGTFYGKQPRIVRINDMPVEVVPSGVLFIIHNQDRPGVVGWIGTVMGKHGVNIANMSLGRDREGGTALTVLNLDSAPSLEAIAEVRKDKDILDVKIAKL